MDCFERSRIQGETPTPSATRRRAKRPQRISSSTPGLTIIRNLFRGQFFRPCATKSALSDLSSINSSSRVHPPGSSQTHRSKHSPWGLSSDALGNQSSFIHILAANSSIQLPCRKVNCKPNEDDKYRFRCAHPQVATSGILLHRHDHKTMCKFNSFDKISDLEHQGWCVDLRNRSRHRRGSVRRG
jgi:hypothetical protein